MPHLQEKLNELKIKIIASFDSVSYPKGNIVEHECDECFRVRNTFLNKNWKKITPKILEENYDKLPLFSPEAFHSFLPAYLAHSLENFVFENVCQFTLYSLTPDKKIKTNPDWWQEKFKYFTLEQINLVYEFLDIAKEEFIHYEINIERGKQRLKEYVEPTIK